jgi:hypothetical protein
MMMLSFLSERKPGPAKVPPNKSMHTNCYPPFLQGYVPAKKWVIVAAIARQQSPKLRH